MIDTLLATLERDADADIARVLGEARAQAAAITAESERRIAERRAQTLGQREVARRMQLERDLAAARQAARRSVLAAREALLERLLMELRRALPDIAAGAAYRASLAGDFERAMACVGTQPAAVRCATGLAPALRELITSNGRLPIQPDTAIAAGFRVVTDDGQLEVDATLESRLERLWPRLALEAVAALS